MQYCNTAIPKYCNPPVVRIIVPFAYSVLRTLHALAATPAFPLLMPACAPISKSFPTSLTQYKAQAMAATSTPTATSQSPDVFISPLQVANSHGFATFPQDFFSLGLHTFPHPTSFVFQAPKATSLAQHHHHHHPQHNHQLGFATSLASPSFANDGSNPPMAADVRELSRNMSLSSSDRELSSDPKLRRSDADLDIDEPSRSSSNQRKRPRTNSIDYPRRRATIAVRSPLAVKSYNG